MCAPKTTRFDFLVKIFDGYQEVMLSADRRDSTEFPLQYTSALEVKSASFARNTERWSRLSSSQKQDLHRLKAKDL